MTALTDATEAASWSIYPNTSFVSVKADNAALGTSDYVNVNVTAERIRFTRDTALAVHGYEYANPGARVRFISSSRRVDFNLYYNALITRTSEYNGIGAVYVDGVFHSTFNKVLGAGLITVALKFSTLANRLIEIAMPYWAGVDFVSLKTSEPIAVPSARTATRLVACGDSITHGAFGTDTTSTWTTQLGVSKNWQVINHGYGLGQCSSAAGTAMAAVNPDVALYLIGYNDFSSQRTLLSFGNAYSAAIAAFRAVKPTAKLYCVSPLWTSATRAIPMSSYRSEISTRVAALADANTIYVDGLTLTTNGAGSFTDGIHPNSTGSTEIATALGLVVAL